MRFGTEWLQGAMILDHPDALAMTYLQQMMSWMLFADGARHIVQLGLGGGGLTKFCYRHFPAARVTAIELDAAVIETCRASFALPADDERLRVFQMDAFDFVRTPENHGSVDILQVDVYDAAVNGPVLDTPQFYAACAGCLTAEGIMVVNLIGEFSIYEKNLLEIFRAFPAVIYLQGVADGNVIVLAFKTPQAPSFTTLYERADTIQASIGLPARSWVDLLKMRHFSGGFPPLLARE